MSARLREAAEQAGIIEPYLSRLIKAYDGLSREITVNIKGVEPGFSAVLTKIQRHIGDGYPRA